MLAVDVSAVVVLNVLCSYASCACMCVAVAMLYYVACASACIILFGTKSGFVDRYKARVSGARCFQTNASSLALRE